MAKFRTKARAVDLLGEQAIKDEATAIAELFKNSHDADAMKAELRVVTKLGALILWDNGCGMSKSHVEDRWLTIGTDSKQSRPSQAVRRTPGDRVMMGEKGVGRLAIATLGRQMLLISKPVDSPQYTLVYIHWDIFTNGGLLLDETTIPLANGNSPDEIVAKLADMKMEQRRNLVGSDGEFLPPWQGDYLPLARRILRDVDAFRVDESFLGQYLDRIGRKGTLFYVTELKENWATLAAAVSSDSKGERLKRKINALTKMMSNFVNSIELFERGGVVDSDDESEEDADDEESEMEESLIKGPKPFTPSIFIDGVQMIHGEVFAPEDLKRYDYGLVGEVVAGVFVGLALIQGRPPKAIEVDLTTGIDIREQSDCGCFRLRLYFVEGEPKNSLLSRDEHREITKKLEDIGGVYVYRDGLRVLPYGTPDFDFLEIERRRTLSLKRHMFSLRRMFGYIAITKEQNPLLEDKSSREGLRENPQYDYFRQVLMNLMEWWGPKYLIKQDLRAKHLTVANEAHKARQALEEATHQRNRDQRAYLSNLKSALKKNVEAVKLAASALRVDIQTQIPAENVLRTQVMLRSKEKVQSYFTLLGIRQKMESIRSYLLRRIAELGTGRFLPVDPRFIDEAEVSKLRASFDTFVERQQHSLREDLEGRWVSYTYLTEELTLFLDRLARQTTLENPDALLSGIRDAVLHVEVGAKELRDNALQLMASALSAKASTYRNRIQSLGQELEQVTTATKKEWIDQIDHSFSSLNEHVADLKTQLDQFSLQSTPAELTELTRNIQARLSETGSAFAQADDHVRGQISQALGQLSVPALDVLDYARYAEDDRKLMGLLQDQLKERSDELEQYRALAATGIAAEIVDHEFNMSYGQVREILSKPEIRNLMNRYGALRELRTLFHHIEARHRVLSPLYRSSRIVREKLRLYGIGEAMRLFFDRTIFHNGIVFRNDIDPDFIVEENESILYPVFINTINNAIYWMMNREHREVLLRVKDGALFIEDSGSGIDVDAAGKIFDLFYTTRTDGRGIGLYLVKQLLEKRGHQISCVTDSTEKKLSGACFRIDFASGDGGTQR